MYVRCKGCRYFVPTHAPGTGDCHRFPPTVMVMPDDGTGYTVQVRPNMRDEDWCGEFRPGKQTPVGGRANGQQEKQITPKALDNCRALPVKFRHL